MRPSLIRRALLAAAIALALVPSAALADWPMYHLDPAHTGNDTASPTATTLTAAWSKAVVGQVYAEPLVAGNLVLIATEQNNVYAFDATTGSIVWQNTSLGAPVPQSALPCGNINPVGITGTPVVDSAAGVVYVAATLAQPALHYELFAISIADGSLRWQKDIAPAGFDPLYQGQRGALALANGNVYIPFGGRAGDCGVYSGWVVQAPANGNGAISAFSLPNGPAMGGIWAASGPAIDAAGNIYVTTGNTSCSASCNPFDYGESVLKLSPTLGLLDYWAPTDYGPLNNSDTDVGSLGPSLLSNGVIFQAGKAGEGYLLRSANLGGIGNAAFSAHVCPGLTADAAFGGTAYDGTRVYVPCDNGLVALTVNTVTPSFAFAWQGPSVAMAGPPIVAGGIVWTIDPGSNAVYGLDPATGAQRFKATLSGANHFVTPAAGCGFLFVPAGDHVDAFRLAPTPGAGFNPSRLTFGNQNPGTTSAVQSSIVTNTGVAPLTVTGIVASGDFAETDNCGTLPASFQPGTGCTISVRFTPTGYGARTGSVSVSDNACGSPQPLRLNGSSFPFADMQMVDGFGGLHAEGGSPAHAITAYWPNWKIVRSAALLPDSTGGEVLDGYGGLHRFGAAAPVSASYFGWDIARDVVLLPAATQATPLGYTLDGWGGIHPFGGAAPVRGAPYWPNFDIARRLALLSDGTGGYVLDGYGGLHPFATGTNPMPPAIVNESYWKGWNIARDVALAPGSTAANVAGLTLDGWGGVHPFGGSGAVSPMGPVWPNWDIARAVRYSPDSTAASPKGWTLDGWGGVHPFGGAASLPQGPYWPNFDIAVELLVR